MKIYNRYLALLALAACLINVILAFAGQKDLAFYFTVDIVAFLLITLLFVYFSPRTRKLLTYAALVYFIGFLMVMIIKIAGIFSQRSQI